MDRSAWPHEVWMVFINNLCLSALTEVMAFKILAILLQQRYSHCTTTYMQHGAMAWWSFTNEVNDGLYTAWHNGMMEFQQWSWWWILYSTAQWHDGVSTMKLMMDSNEDWVSPVQMLQRQGISRCCMQGNSNIRKIHTKNNYLRWVRRGTNICCLQDTWPGCFCFCFYNGWRNLHSWIWSCQSNLRLSVH